MLKNTVFINKLEKFSKSLFSKLKLENKSENTLASYKNTFTSFFKYVRVCEEITLLTIKEQDILDFFSSRDSLKSSSALIMLSHLRRLFKFIERNSDELYDFDRVFEDIKIKKVTSKPKGLSKKEQKKLIEYLDELMDKTTQKSAFITHRDSFLIKLMLFSGLRISEALSITLGHLIEATSKFKSLEFVGKGSKERFSLIKNSIIEREVDFFTNECEYDINIPIATTTNNTPLNRSNFYIIAKRIFDKAGVNQKGLHILRHSFAKNIIEEGQSITVLQALLGHSSLQTTSVYTNPTKQTIIDSVTKGVRNDT